MIRQKKAKYAKKGHDVDEKNFEVLDDNQIMLKLLDDSVQLMKKEAAEETPEKGESPDRGRDPSVLSPFRHIKVKNIERVIHYLRYSNNKEA